MLTEETVGAIIAALALGALLYFMRQRLQSQDQPQGSTPPVAATLAAAADPDLFVAGPEWFIANQPYYFAPPVGNIMPAAAQSRTIDSGPVAGACGCN